MIDLASEKHSQLDLFNPPTAKPALMLTLDHINQRYGSDTLFVAAQGIEQKWAMRRDLLTPQYTTKWRSVPCIKC
ncbi:XRE family transcriptional regulator [Shewanella putrefaciens]|nr:XRE family transcriptional regulator [Shewanella putrefaciens]